MAAVETALGEELAHAFGLRAREGADPLAGPAGGREQ
jgi:hypothetical protein